MKKIFLLVTILHCQQFIFCQTTEIPEKITQTGFGKIDFFSINMPISNIENEPNMGYTGIHYNLFLNDWSYAGMGLYGSVTGVRGGFFTLGVNAGIKKYLSNKFYIDTGFHFGGGGGKGAPDGGGAFIAPHFNFGFDFNHFSINSGWSYVDFFDKGTIKSHQLNVSVEVPLNFEYSSFKNIEKEFDISELATSSWNQKTKKNSLMVHFNNLYVSNQSKSNTALKGEIIQLAGFEFSPYLTKNLFAFLKVDGAYHGIRGGYMDVFLGGGYHLAMNKNRTNILAKFGVGAGGGGGVESDGGFMLYPDISIEQKLFSDIYLSINKGYMFTPSRYFFSSTFGAGLKYYIDRNGTKTDTNSFTKAKFKGIEVIVKQDLYFNAKRIEEPTEDMHQISLQINLDLNKHLFVAGQTSFANFGNAGAYGEGLVGLGVKTNPVFKETTTFFTQFLGGASGGGNISTGQGLIIKPSLGFDYNLNNTLSIRSAVGYVKAKGGDLSNAFINLGIKYSISFLKLK